MKQLIVRPKTIGYEVHAHKQSELNFGSSKWMILHVTYSVNINKILTIQFVFAFDVVKGIKKSMLFFEIKITCLSFCIMSFIFSSFLSNAHFFLYIMCVFWPCNVFIACILMLILWALGKKKKKSFHPCMWNYYYSQR